MNLYMTSKLNVGKYLIFTEKNKTKQYMLINHLRKVKNGEHLILELPQMSHWIFMGSWESFHVCAVLLSANSIMYFSYFASGCFVAA